MTKISGHKTASTEAGSSELRKNVMDVDWASRLTPYHHLKPKEKIGVPNLCSIAIGCGSDEFCNQPSKHLWWSF